jgi:hypothetical protein
VLFRSIAAGELPDSVDGDTLLDAIYGPLYYRLFMGHQPLTEEFADEAFDVAVMGASANAKQKKSSR